MSTQIKSAFNMDAMKFSAITTAQMIPTVLFSLIIGLFVDKVGIKKGVLVALVISTLSLYLKINVQTYNLLFILCMGGGIVGSFFNSVNAKAVNMWFDKKEIPVCMGILQASLSLGQLLSLALCGAYNFRTIYLVTFIIAAIILVLWLLFIKENNNVIENNKPNLKEAFKYKESILIGLALFCLFGGFGTITSFLPSKLIADNMSSEKAGLITSICAIARFTGALSFPLITSKLKDSKILEYILLLTAGISVLLIGFVNNYIIISILVFIVGYVVGGITPILFGLPLKIKGIKEDNIASVSGIVSMLQILGAVVVPSYICGLIAGTNYALLYSIGGIIAILSLLLYIMVKKRVN